MTGSWNWGENVKFDLYSSILSYLHLVFFMRSISGFDVFL